MAKQEKFEKTNAVRLLTQAGIPFEIITYEVDEEDLSGVHVAESLGQPPEQVFKTLVVRGEKTGLAVFCIPVAEELDLKKCAIIRKDKKMEMIAVKELLGLTGYIRGGCSPVGMKKKYPTYIDKAATLFDTIFVSAGARGMQFKLNPEQLAAYVQAFFCDLTVS
ncbi:MAG: Cys-tRNA(Pro) deacylase [Lachnospiraceae bacterium]|nr:Cys-tRNA(Pro) deacylase [Lachnospiraceae bacterium]